ncbi:MAG: plasmid stabilization protein [Candidatus Hydrogenedentes bacterium]|nr:plasmid stabilization protein [Candidatus Hydrogenedentota bacterium]
MASITIRNLPDNTKETLRVRAAERGVSLEAYVRNLLQEELARAPDRPFALADAARSFFGPKHGVDLELPRRETRRATPEFGG